MNQDLPNTFLQEIFAPAFQHSGMRVFVYRLDLARPDYSGNKYYKLTGLADRLALRGDNTVVSFGGRWSNHLLALSQYGKDHGINTVGLVRDVSDSGTTALLAQCEANGMRLHYLNAANYRRRHTDAKQLLADLSYRGDVYILPEGGSSGDAIHGCEAIGAELNAALGAYHHVVVPVGTGATMAGLVRAGAEAAHIHGVAVTKKYSEQQQLISDAASGLKTAAWSLQRLPELHGYGVLSTELINFIHQFEAQHNIPLDPNYTAKAFYWFAQALNAGRFAHGDTVVLLHTGGLAGRKGYPEVFAAD